MVSAREQRQHRTGSAAGARSATAAAANLEAVRRHNLGTLLRYVHIHGATSRAELTDRLGLNRSTIGTLTADLVTAGLVTETVPTRNHGAGRPSLVVRPRSTRVFAYAFSVEVDRLRAARVGLGGVVLERRDLPRPPGAPLPETLEPLATLAHGLHRGVPADALCVGSAVAVAGVLRQADGTLAMSPRATGAVLQGRLGDDRAPLVGDVADLAALAEHVRGAATGLRNVIYLHGDASIGAGIIADGQRVTGHGGHGGEVGHMVVNPDGQPCWCGSRGCWETEVGERALLRRAGRDGAGGSDAVLAVVDAAARGDHTAQAAVRHVADWLGFGVANLVTIVNPEAVLFGGTLGDLYLAGGAQVRGRLDGMALPACREHVRLRTSILGDDAPLMGAAELAFERLLEDPLEVAGGDAPAG
ncbi:ROK family transcriptional regulator [Planosporangium sp. 12N6]|uniref:ROK family transcriptional regulator n=1 Tax=Planosporangium spinosum TaxID=3402278 RepID=UPI003CF5934E